MLVVVFQHIRAFGFGLMANDSVLSIVYLTFMLPAFFLVSGFTSFKVNNKPKSLVVTLYSRFRQLIIPTIVFLLLHNFLGGNYEKWSFPGGYWFTYSLFLIILIYSVIQKIVSDKLFIPVLIVISISFIVARGYYGADLDSGWVKYLTLRKIFTYFQFFALGVIIRKYYKETLALINRPTIRNSLIILVFAGFILSERLNTLLPSFVNSLFENVLSCLATLLVFMLFYIFRSIFEKESLFSRLLCFSGTRTLDLYMLHYFFIPSLVVYGYMFTSTGNCAIELAVVGVLTIIVTFISLTLSSILRISPIIAHWLFGAKKFKPISK